MNGKMLMGIAAAVSMLGLLATGCDSDLMKSYNRDRERQEVESKTPPFNPSYYRDATRRHLAISFDIADGVLTASDSPAQVRPGRLPYHSPTAGNVLVVFKDAKGKELGRYAIEDPALARSCDFDQSRVGDVKPIKRGKVEILLPFNLSIESVQIGRIGKAGKEFSVRDQIAAAKLEK